MKSFNNLLEKTKRRKSETQVGMPEQRQPGRLSVFMQKTDDRLRKYALTPGYLISLLFCSFLCASIVAHICGDSFGKLEFSISINLPLYIAVFAFSFFILTKITILWKKQVFGDWSLLVLTLCYAGMLSGEKNNNLSFCIAISVVVFIVVRYLTANNRPDITKIKCTWNTSTIVLCITVSVFTIVIGLACIARYTDFGGATFDIGIFTQMFEYMRSTGKPDTTVERYELTSHFAVHFSPFFYVLLPGYMLWSHPSYLLFVQALAIALCVFPIRRICKTLGLSPLASTAASLIWIFFPSNAYGCFNDFHENKFLPLCLFWMLSMLLEKRKFAFLPFAVLALSVKEDTAIYVACIALFLFFTQKEKKNSIILLVLSVAWFFFATAMIQKFGGEAMMSRFAAYQAEGSDSVFGVIKTCVLNVGYLLMNILKEDRLSFILWMFIPVLFAPFLNKNMWTLLLLAPMVVINLMPTWTPQHDILYQYTYGTATLLIFASILTFAQMKPQTRRFCLTAAVCISFVFCMGNTVQKVGGYFQRAEKNAEQIRLSEELLDMIPEDASVTARDYVVPHLYDHKNLYTVPCFYGAKVSTDYYVTDKRQDSSEYNKQMYEFIDANNYELVCDQGYLQLWKHTD